MDYDMDFELMGKAIRMIKLGYSKLSTYYFLGLTRREMDLVDWCLSFEE